MLMYTTTAQTNCDMCKRLPLFTHNATSRGTVQKNEKMVEKTEL